jgi:hypothetical protein
MGSQKLFRDVTWLAPWGTLAGTFACLQFLGKSPLPVLNRPREGDKKSTGESSL